MVTLFSNFGQDLYPIHWMLLQVWSTVPGWWEDDLEKGEFWPVPLGLWVIVGDKMTEKETFT